MIYKHKQIEKCKGKNRLTEVLPPKVKGKQIDLKSYCLIFLIALMLPSLALAERNKQLFSLDAYISNLFNYDQLNNSFTYHDANANLSFLLPPCSEDNDGDEVCDEEDLDDDNDGILDSDERRCDIPNIANSTEGSGIYQDQLYFFNWDGADFANGLDDGDTQTFNLADGLTITATVSGVSDPAAGDVYLPSKMKTWNGAFLISII